MEQGKPNPEQDINEGFIDVQGRIERGEVLSLEEVDTRFVDLRKRILEYLEGSGEPVEPEEIANFRTEAYTAQQKYCPPTFGKDKVYNEDTERIEAMVQITGNYEDREAAKDEDVIQDYLRNQGIDSKEYILTSFQKIYDKHFDEKGKFKNINKPQ